MDLQRREAWLRYGADMLRNRRCMSEQKFHAYFGIHSVTAVWLWSFLLPRWPHGKTLLLPPHLLWTLWFLRKYPTEDHLLEVARTSGLVRQVVWGYVMLIAPLLPFPPLDRRFDFNEAPRALQLSYSMVVDTLFVKTFSPQPSNREDFDQNWKQWFNGDPKKGGFGVKIEVAVSISNHPRLLWFNVAPAGTQDGRIAELPGGLFSRLREGEMVLTDGETTYQGSSRCHAPPHRRMRTYVPEFDKAELTVQRGVERCNKWIRDWQILNGADGIFRCSPRSELFWPHITCAVSTVCKLIAIDQELTNGIYY